MKKAAAYIVSLALGLVLLYLALQDVDLAQLKSSFQNASYIWVLPTVLVVLISHAIRAWRWQILLEALPDHQFKNELGKVSFKNSFLSLLIGYFANLLVPRLGEIARSGTLSKQEGIRFSGVFGTVVIARILDVLVLVIGLGSLSVLFYDQFLFLQSNVLTPITERLSLGWSVTIALSVCVLGLATVQTIRVSKSPRLTKFRRRLFSMANSFKEGVLTLLHAPRRFALLSSTVLMWLCYVLMAWLTFVMLDMHTQYSLGLQASWSIMLFGAVGFAIPSPGGTGSFHLITKLALINLYFVDEVLAVAYGFLSHGLHVIIYVVAGLIALYLQGTSLKALRSTPTETDQTS